MSTLADKVTPDYFHWVTDIPTTAVTMYNMSFSFILHLLRQPLYQAVLFLLITLISIPLLSSKNANAIWNMAGVLYIGFILTNAVFFWFAAGTWTYFFTSLGLSLLYILAAGALVPSLISALKIAVSGESAGIFLFIIYHPLILSGNQDSGQVQD